MRPELLSGFLLSIDDADTKAVQYGRFVPDFLDRTPTQAVRSVTLPIAGLSANSVVRRLEVRITSRPADRARLDTTQVRSYPTSDSSKPQLVSVAVDFGTMVTVSAVATPKPKAPAAHADTTVVQVYRVKTWNGQTFAPQPAYIASGAFPPTGVATVTPTPPATAEVVLFAAEVRTEKLLLETVTALSATGNYVAQVPGFIELQLPEPPSGLELVTQDGALVFSHPAQTAPTAGQTEITDRSWNQNGVRRVDLVPVLAARTGDPTSRADVPLTLTLTSRVPGLLELVEVAERDVAWLERIALGPDGPGELRFDGEGVSTTPLALPAEYSHVEAARAIASGKIGPERVVPAIGPTASPEVEMVLTADVAGSARLPAATGLATLNGVRLALAADPGGAEVRVVALGHVPGPLVDGEAGDPGAPLPGGQSAPVTIAAGASAVTAPWVTFAFDKPIAFTEEARPWIAIQVTRGKVRWALAAATPTTRVAIRRGPPEGPWVKLPSVFRTPPVTGMLDLRNLGARLRAVGLAAPDHPIPPFSLSITNPGQAATAHVGVTPTAKGVPVAWPSAVSPPGLAIAQPGALALEVVSHVAGALTLRELDLTLSKNK